MNISTSLVVCSIYLDDVRQRVPIPQHPPRAVATNPVEHYTDASTVRVFAGTYNVNGRAPANNIDLHPWLQDAADADLVVIGFQVCMIGAVVCAGRSMPMYHDLCLCITTYYCVHFVQHLAVAHV